MWAFLFFFTTLVFAALWVVESLGIYRIISKKGMPEDACVTDSDCYTGLLCAASDAGKKQCSVPIFTSPSP